MTVVFFKLVITKNVEFSEKLFGIIILFMFKIIINLFQIQTEGYCIFCLNL